MSEKLIKAFITYSHKDTKYKEELEVFLSVMKRSGEITSWSDNEILAGDVWREKISENLLDSDILLFLTSAYSLGSTDCNKELTEALENRKDIHLIPIILESCDWQNHQISDFQALPTDDKHNLIPICDWRPESRAWQVVVGGIRARVEALRKEATEQPTDHTEAERWFQHGNELYFLRALQSAIRSYDKAISLNPQYAQAYYNRGLAKKALGQYEQAIAAYDKAIDLNPQDLKAHYNRGTAKAKLGQRQEAAADFHKAIGLNPQDQDAEAYYNRGNANAELGHHQEAIVDYDKAIGLNPKFAKAHNNLGVAKVALGQYKAAVVDFGNAIDLNQQYAKAYKNRGFTKAALGQHDAAAVDFDKAKAIHLNL